METVPKVVYSDFVTKLKVMDSKLQILCSQIIKGKVKFKKLKSMRAFCHLRKPSIKLSSFSKLFSEI